MGLFAGLAAFLVANGLSMHSAYSKLGGQAVFGVALTQAEANALSAVYSEQRARLEPHVGVKLGS